MDLLLNWIFELATVSAVKPGTPGTPGGSGGEYIGSVGHLVAASLETAGLYAQETILNDFSQMLHDTGALFYLLSIVGAVFSVAIFGNYRKALYLFIAPPLFFFMIKHTESVEATRIQVGNRVKTNSAAEQEQFRTFVDYLIGREHEEQRTAEVSWFFYFVDEITSKVTKSVEALLLDEEGKQDLLAYARARAFSSLVLKEVANQRYYMLLALGLHGNCAELSRKKLALAELQIDERNQEGSQKQRILTDYNRSRNAAFVIIEGELLDFLRMQFPSDFPAGTESKQVHCEKVWHYTVELAKKAARSEIELLKQKNPQSDIPWEKAVEQAVATLAGDTQGAVSREPGTPTDDRAVRALATFILRNTIPKATSLAMTSQVFEHVPYDTHLAPKLFRDLAGAESWGGWIKIQYFAGTVPYIQGLLLYLLSCAFPFFALYLLLPGHAQSFLVWITLWIWVKSWDVGFAMVTLARDLMWQFVVHGVNHENDQINLDDQASFFKLIAENDPLATENTYYYVTSLLMISVPLLTAHLCMGATHLFDSFKNAIDNNANRFGLQASLGSRRLWGSQLEKEQHERIGDVASDRARRRWDSEPQIYGGIDLKKDTNDETGRWRLQQMWAEENFKETWSPQTYEDKATLALATKRRMSFTGTEAQGYLDAKAAEMSIPFLVRTPGTESTTFFNPQSSDKPGVDDSMIISAFSEGKSYGGDEGADE